MKFRIGWLALALSVVAGLPAAASASDGGNAGEALAGRPYYVSPMFSYTINDSHRGLDDGMGGMLSIGKRINDSVAVELTGSYLQSDWKSGNNTQDLSGAGLAALFMPFKSNRNFYLLTSAMAGHGNDVPGAIDSYDSVMLDLGTGYIQPLFTRYVALRAEARFRVDEHGDNKIGVPANKGGAFGDGVFNVGLLFPIGLAPLDTDGDGVADDNDKCPDSPAGQRVGPDGCEIDSDGDGVADSADQCPGTPAGAKVDAKGCETDSDGDGVLDSADQCPDTPAGAKVDDKGCSTDNDGDGVPNDVDECPNTPAGAKVLANGCSLVDDCRTPRPGEQVDENGCAVEQKFILKGVKFEFNSDRLTPEARSILDDVAGTLQAYASVDVELQGHTDNIGTEAYNQGLSEKRANAVKRYLVGKGVSADRMKPVGYGESNPIASNDTDEGREENRRVELKVIEE